MEKELEEVINGFVEQGFTIAQKNVNTDGRKVEPVVFVFGENQIYVILVPWDNNEAKIATLKEVGKKCVELDAHRLALLVDVAMKKYDNPEDALYASRNPETEAPLSYPESMRIDGLLINYMDFKDPDDELLRMYPYKVKDGQIVREPMQDLPGNFTGTLKNALTFGFVQACIMKEFRIREMDTMDTTLVEDILDTIIKDYPGIKPSRSFEELHDA